LHPATSDQANVTFNGTAPGKLGRDSVVSADFNGDNYRDLAFASRDRNLSGGLRDYTGQAYVFFGSQDGFHSSTVADANITLNGSYKSYSFGDYLNAADFDRDGLSELVVQAYGPNLSGGAADYTGAVYIYSFNLKPTFSAIPNISISEDSSTSLNLSLYFSDINRENLNYTAVGSNSIAVSIDEATNVVTFTPAANWYGTEYITFYGNDSYNALVASNNITVAVANTADCGDSACDASESCSSCAADCGTCPVTLGATSSPALPGSSSSVSSAAAGETVALKFSDRVPVSAIEFTAKEAVSNVKIDVREISAPSETVAGKAYKYMKISATNLDNMKFGTAKIKFAVDKAWADENAESPSEIALMHFDNAWKELGTAYTGTNGNKYYYAAETGSFSTFAIALKQAEAEQEPAEETPQERSVVQAEEDSAEAELAPSQEEVLIQEKSSAVWWIAVPISILILAAIIISAILLKKGAQWKKRL
jgi:PGF-pre-PGF domain-containing protein